MQANDPLPYRTEFSNGIYLDNCLCLNILTNQGDLMDKRLMKICFVLLIPFILSAADDIQKLTGKWEYKTEEGTITMEFKSENLLIYNGEEIYFMLVDGSIRVEDEFLGYVDYPYTLKEGLLTITYPEGYSLQFKKAKSQTKDKGTADKGTGSTSELVQHFSGTWKNYTKHTETMVVLYPDGTYGQRYTSSYGSSESGEEWGAAGDVHQQGRWTVQGNLESGVIIFIDQDGSETQYQYQVHVENGETYWREYYFNGDLYGKVNE